MSPHKKKNLTSHSVLVTVPHTCGLFKLSQYETRRLPSAVFLSSSCSQRNSMPFLGSMLNFFRPMESCFFFWSLFLQTGERGALGRCE